MCCSVSPGTLVKFSNTLLYAGEVIDNDGQTVHVIGCQNTIQNIPRNNENNFFQKFKNLLRRGNHNGNALIIPFPAIPKTMSAANMIDTRQNPAILKDLARAAKNKSEESKSFLGNQPTGRNVEVFEASGIYSVVLAHDIKEIPDALHQVPKEKRPQLNYKLFAKYAEWYPDWTFVLCCFNNREAQEALPMLWWYEPLFPQKLFLPTLDGRSGEAPKLNESVAVDYTMMVGSCFADSYLQAMRSAINCPKCHKPNQQGLGFCLYCDQELNTEEGVFYQNYQPVSYSKKNNLEAVIKPYLLTKVMGETYRGVLPNSDMWWELDEVRKGIWKPEKRTPPILN